MLGARAHRGAASVISVVSGDERLRAGFARLGGRLEVMPGWAGA
ncbi:hypothetical protein [Streptomyces sp. PHES57]|nr:hypothetical protein [Streptomyces sp. PHES57]